MQDPLAATDGTDNNVPAEMITIITNDGNLHKINLNIAKMSGTISDLMVLLENQDNVKDDDEPIPLHNLNSKTFGWIIEWCEKHQFDKKEDKVDNGETMDETTNQEGMTDISEWDQSFVAKPHDDLIELILGANYLDIPKLLKLCCKELAQMIAGKNVEEIRKHFNIINDFEENEEILIRQQNEWMQYPSI